MPRAAKQTGSDYTTRALIKRICRDFISGKGRKISYSIGCMFLVAAATAAHAWMMQPALDKVFLEKNHVYLIVLPIAVLIISIIKGVATYGQHVIMRNLGQRVVCDMQIKLFDHLMQADLSMFHDQSSGRMVSKFTNDINLLKNSTISVFTGIAKELITALFLLGVMLYQSPELSLIALVIFPLAVHPILKLGRRMRKVSASAQHEMGNFTARLDETFQNIRVVKAYCREQEESRRAGEVINRLYEIFAKSSRIQAASSPIMELLAGIAVAGVIWYGGQQVLSGETTPGSFFSFIAAMIMAYRPVKTLAGLNSNLQEGMAAAQRLYEVLDTREEIRQPENPSRIEGDIKTIAFEDVSFSYNSQLQVVQNINFELGTGKKVALVGTSGGGKSTLFNLLLRFYDVSSGRITINGIDIRDMDTSHLRSFISLVTQESILFDDTISANIAIGNQQATEEQIQAAAKAAGVDEFVQAMPMGYNTQIGQNGVKLSGGQRQRIAIARAMLKNAPILLLDEATSALDTKTEAQVQDSLDRLSEGRATLVIAHRLSTIRDADQILVIANGRIIESGTHAELLEKGGEYHSMWQRQSG